MTIQQQIKDLNDVVEVIYQKMESDKKLLINLLDNISYLQDQCPHLNPDNTSAIKYSSTDSFTRFYKCPICNKEFKGNPHK